jgi:hypothetical protein
MIEVKCGPPHRHVVKEEPKEKEGMKKKEEPKKKVVKMIVDGVYSYQSSYGFTSGQIPRCSQGTLLPSSGEPKVSNPWNNVQRKDSI